MAAPGPTTSAQPVFGPEHWTTATGCWSIRLHGPGRGRERPYPAAVDGAEDPAVRTEPAAIGVGEADGLGLRGACDPMPAHPASAVFSSRPPDTANPLRGLMKCTELIPGQGSARVCHVRPPSVVRIS